MTLMFLYAIGYVGYTSVRVDQEICNTFKMFCFKRILFQTQTLINSTFQL